VTSDELYMQRCLELAQHGAGHVSPNPLVGAVIVHNNRIIGEGWHKCYGKAHAEVNAIHSVEDKSLLHESTVYVNLEPCSHHGKTPPCADLLIMHQVKKVVVGIMDPFEQVAGNGIRKLKEAGIDVVVGVLQQQCEELNKRFITFHTKKRPYIILKWAQTQDGFIAPDANSMPAEEFEQKRHITGLIVQKLVHKWRSEEDAIMVGTNTAITDNPALNTRAWKGSSPIRIALDRTLRIPTTHQLFDQKKPTIIFTEKKVKSSSNITYISIDFNDALTSQIIDHLYQKNIQSLIIEGGTKTLETFIQKQYWDEAQVFISPKTLGNGIQAPSISGEIFLKDTIDASTLTVYRNK
jgi:diaminohydroxyphosphoribosylaminopyrimidine deaminase/5-amino-6-(5-phosphoribosylamino)uracil reductase